MPLSTPFLFSLFPFYKLTFAILLPISFAATTISATRFCLTLRIIISHGQWRITPIPNAMRNLRGHKPRAGVFVLWELARSWVTDCYLSGYGTPYTAGCMPTRVVAISLQAPRVEALLDQVRASGHSTAEVLNEVIAPRHGSPKSAKSTAMHRACQVV